MSKETALAVSQLGFIISKSLCIAVQGGYFFMHKTIIVTNKVKQIMYSTQTPPFHKGSLATAASGGKREHSAV